MKWWLGIVPEHTTNFLRLILIVGLCYTLSNPLITSVHATGNIKKFQIVEGSMLVMIVPIAYLLLKFCHIKPEIVFVVHIMVELCTQYARMRIVLPMINITMVDYVKNVVLPILWSSIIASLIPLWVCFNVKEHNICSFLLVGCVSALSSTITIYLLGCTTGERTFFARKFKNVFKKIRE